MRAAMWLVLAGCNLQKPTLAPVDAADGDDTSQCTTFSTQLDTCALPAPLAALEIDSVAVYDTDTGLLSVSAMMLPLQHQAVIGPAGPIDVVIATDLMISPVGVLTVTGKRPVGFVVTGDVTVDGVIDVGVGGAGTRSIADCGTSAGGLGESDVSGGGGGGGGGFQRAGSPGGTGDFDGTLSMGGPGGAAGTKPPGLLGGCSGSIGGSGMSVGGAGGLGGGAILIASSQRLVVAVNGRIVAGGGGGKGGSMIGPPNDGGGGGGGSGGMILLEAPLVNVAGKLAANGGGGGEGSGNGTGNDGVDGGATTAPASGGKGGSATGGDGGSGDAGMSSSQIGLQGQDGGGGGGGGVGFIAIATLDNETTGATISPPAVTWP